MTDLLDELLESLCPTCSDPVADHEDGQPCPSAFGGPLEPPAGYPITEEGWVTFSRVRMGGGVFLVQRRDGCSRTIPASEAYRRAPGPRVQA